MAPGVLYVTMQPREGLSLAEFNDWYNNEHGPVRLRLGSVFASGKRYRAIDGEKPEFMAAYDVHDLDELSREPYTALRAARSEREAAVIARIDVKRTFYRVMETAEREKSAGTGENGAPSKLEDDGTLVLAVETAVDGAVGTWRSGLLELPHWRRSRLLEWVEGEKPGVVATETTHGSYLLALHEFSSPDDSGEVAPDLAGVLKKPPIIATGFGAPGGPLRTYKHYYTFTAAPRDLVSLSQLEDAAASKHTAFEYADFKASTTSGILPSISATLPIKTGSGDLQIP
jgi:hypothetical protein